MNIKKITYLIILLLIFLYKSKAQSFQQDWSNFKDCKWKIKFVTDSYIKLLDEKNVGQLVFHNKLNKDINIRFFIYTESLNDTLLAGKLMKYGAYQSCRGYKNVSNFYLKDNLYYIEYCNECLMDQKKVCLKLMNKIQKYVRKETINQ